MKEKHSFLSEKESEIQPLQSKQLTRRQAIRQLLAGVAGLTVLGQVFTSCKPRRQPRIEQNIVSERPIPCTACNACMPCPYGVDIPGNFLLMNEQRGYNAIPDPRQAKRRGYDIARRRFIAEYDGRIARLAQADHCIGCGKCIPLCRQKIDIITEMKRIDMLINKLKGE